MRTDLKVNVVSAINITVVSDFNRTLLIAGLYRSASALSSWRTNTVVEESLSHILFTGRNLPTLPYPTCIWRPHWG